jgi:hypothetical protein
MSFEGAQSRCAADFLGRQPSGWPGHWGFALGCGSPKNRIDYINGVALLVLVVIMCVGRSRL